jgi:hypothetical protein
MNTSRLVILSLSLTLLLNVVFQQNSLTASDQESLCPQLENKFLFSKKEWKSVRWDLLNSPTQDEEKLVRFEDGRLLFYSNSSIDLIVLGFATFLFMGYGIRGIIKAEKPVESGIAIVTGAATGSAFIYNLIQRQFDN